MSNPTKDIRSLGDYIEHFAKYDNVVINPNKSSLNTIGSIEGSLVFVPVLYKGRTITKEMLE